MSKQFEIGQKIYYYREQDSEALKGIVEDKLSSVIVHGYERVEARYQVKLENGIVTDWVSGNKLVERSD